MKARTKRILLICYLTLVFSVTIILAYFLSKEGKGLFSILGTINLYWLAGALGCMGIYLCMESWAVHYITSFMYKKMGFFYMMKINLIGNYYGALTPAAMGFQPSQIAYLKRDGVPVGVSTFIQTIKLMAYEVVIVFLCLVFLVIRGHFFIANYPEIFWLSIFGALVNIFVISMMILAIIKRTALKKMVIGLTRFLAWLKIVKNIEKVHASVENTLDEFHDSAKYLLQYKWKVVKACLLTLVQWLMFFTIPYCLYNAFGLGLLNGQPGALGALNPFDEALNLVVMAAFLFLAVHFMPIPGSSGATEAGFGIFFGKIFFTEAAAAMFIWRLITYYSVIVVGFIIILVDGVSHKGKKLGDKIIMGEDENENGLDEDSGPGSPGEINAAENIKVEGVKT
jgi:glycosyltransferase 2 family protein